MKISQFDAHNNQSITVEVVGPSYNQVIEGDGYFIIPNPQGKNVSFCKGYRDTCLGDVTKNIISDYTNQQYADEYGSRLTGMGVTVKEYLIQVGRYGIV